MTRYLILILLSVLLSVGLGYTGGPERYVRIDWVRIQVLTDSQTQGAALVDAGWRDVDVKECMGDLKRNVAFLLPDRVWLIQVSDDRTRGYDIEGEYTAITEIDKRHYLHVHFVTKGRWYARVVWIPVDYDHSVDVRCIGKDVIEIQEVEDA